LANVLFVCKQNAGRSQMSEAIFASRCGPGHHARSAGTTPAAALHPEVVEVMGELGIDLSGRTPQALSDEAGRWADVVVTMGCGDECPYIAGKRYIDWDLLDPNGRPAAEVRQIRDAIAERVEMLLASLAAS
jgi:arsenate reductase